LWNGSTIIVPNKYELKMNEEIANRRKFLCMYVYVYVVYVFFL
jgi:hypothetical protein